QRPHGGMLEAQPLDRVGQFDIDAEIVGVELEIVAIEQPRFLVDVHHQCGDFAVDSQLPMAIARRLGLKTDAHAIVTALAGNGLLYLAHHGLPRRASTASAEVCRSQWIGLASYVL